MRSSRTVISLVGDGLPASRRDPRRVLPRGDARQRPAGHLYERRYEADLLSLASASRQALRLAHRGVLPDGQPLPPGSADRKPLGLARDAGVEWWLCQGFQWT